MVTVRIAHTAELDPTELARIRALLNEAFADFDDHDWGHSLGGLHALVATPDRVIAHGAVVQRQLIVGDRVLRAGYVEAVAVASDHRGQGYAAAMMAELERIVEAAYELGALSSSGGVEPFYTARGWLPWRGETWALTPAGRQRTPDEDDSTFVRPVSTVDIDRTAALTCDYRAGDLW